MTQSVDVVFWFLLLALASVGAMAFRYRRSAVVRAQRVRVLEQEAAVLERELSVRNAEARHLVEQRLPAAANQLWSGQRADVPALLHTELAGTPFAGSQDAVIQLFAKVGEQAGQRAEEAAQAAVKAVTRSVQALVNEQQGAVSAMLDRHSDPQVLADANAIDHTSSQLGRRAQVLGMLTGSWPGRQRVTSPLLDVVRGGASRIRDFARIDVNGELPVSVVSRAVEPVVLAVAELLDNAARHSEPSATVQVWFQQSHNGVGIVIDDSGVGLKPEDQDLAARLLAGRDPVLLTRLRSPLKLGFAAVGLLAARYGFAASVDASSPFGGTRAVVYLPKDLLTTATDHVPGAASATVASTAPGPAVVGPAAPAVSPRPTPATAPVPQPSSDLGQPSQSRPDGLPQRRRRQPQQYSAADGPRMQTPMNSGRGLGALIRGRRAARDQMNTGERNV
ncbi:ATP-binding protein [Streptomyces sp. NPDC059679]|uniref:ATP-binding protein n=1 Tax=Streptomyces sp. NPDC059679 TaxID=3346903 RepID=UPI0036A612B2